jgi:hypothetical protein
MNEWMSKVSKKVSKTEWMNEWVKLIEEWVRS